MIPIDILKEIDSLPKEAQKEVSDFIAFLKTRYPVSRNIRKSKRIRLADEPFIGMWQGREDMRDSTAWVRRLRSREWKTDEDNDLLKEGQEKGLKGQSHEHS
ncbi:MAG: hypothetical protein BWK80_54580 [Desulfobacteraceae bacterium IS3]|nr:MAG: hypothetical protein BWK80_54580 [Desulfobacteraceae bacterium IS3]